MLHRRLLLGTLLLAAGWIGGDPAPATAGGPLWDRSGPEREARSQQGAAQDPAVAQPGDDGLDPNIEAYREQLACNLLRRYNNLPKYAGRIHHVEIVPSQAPERSLDGSEVRVEFAQLVYDKWGKRVPALEEEYFVITFGHGTPRLVRTDPTITTGLAARGGFSEHEPVTGGYVGQARQQTTTPTPLSRAPSPAGLPEATCDLPGTGAAAMEAYLREREEVCKAAAAAPSQKPNASPLMPSDGSMVYGSDWSAIIERAREKCSTRPLPSNSAKPLSPPPCIDCTASPAGASAVHAGSVSPNDLEIPPLPSPEPLQSLAPGRLPMRLSSVDAASSSRAEPAATKDETSSAEGEGATPASARSARVPRLRKPRAAAIARPNGVYLVPVHRNEVRGIPVTPMREVPVLTPTPDLPAAEPALPDSLPALPPLSATQRKIEPELLEF